MAYRAAERMKGRQFNKITISASLMIVVVAVFWIWSSYQAARSTLESMAAERVARLESAYQTNLEHYGRFMTQLALVVGNETDINTLFYQGGLAVQREGGGAGGAEAAAIRAALTERLSTAWALAGEQGIARELHFHLPPATSFLRLHNPSQFGDDLSDVRDMVVATNRSGQPAFGVEVGVASGGIRGVVPISHTTPDGRSVHVGTLEAGTSLAAMLDMIAREVGAEFSILLDDAHMRRSLGAPAYARLVEDQPSVNNLRVMTSTDMDGTLSLLNAIGYDGLVADDWQWLREAETTAFAIARIPLRDFAGDEDEQRADIGTVLAWVSLDEQLVTFKRDVAEAVVIALFVVFFLEAMLFFALGQEQKLALQRKASVTDSLTGVSNRRAFDEALDAEIRRAARSGHPVTLVMADVDYFKRYNDHYGHQSGDECLRRVAASMGGELRRAGDFIARYGGEEFVVILPDSSLSAGLAVAEKLRRSVENLKIPHDKHPGGKRVTISLGVAAGRVSQNDAKALVAMADEALYRAKGAGRNNSQGLRFGDDDNGGQPLPLLYR